MLVPSAEASLDPGPAELQLGAGLAVDGVAPNVATTASANTPAVIPCGSAPAIVTIDMSATARNKCALNADSGWRVFAIRRDSG